MKNKILISFMVFIFTFGGIAFAQFSVDVDVVPKSFGAAPCGIATYDILINNTGKDDTFAVFIDGIPTDWYTLTDDVVQLKSEQTKTIYLFVTADCFSPEKTYQGNVTIKGQSKSTVPFTLSVVPDHIIDVALQNDISFCLCEEGTIPVTISNKGLFDEDIDLTLGGTSISFVSMTTTGLALKTGESRTINLTIANMCQSEHSISSLEVVAKSRNSYAKDSAASVIKRNKCHDFDVTFDKEIITCAVEEKPFSIVVKNTGSKTDTFEVNIPAFNVTQKTTLSPEESATINSTFLTTNARIYNITFTVSSSVATKEDSIDFVAQSCYDVDVQVESNEITIVSGKGKLLTAKVLNKGSLPDNYELTIDVPWVSIRPQNLTLEGNESGILFAYYSPEFGAKGKFDTRLAAKSERSQDEEMVSVNVVDKEETSTTSTSTTLNESIDISPVTDTIVSVNETTTEVQAGGSLLERVKENRFLLSILVGALIAIGVFVVLYFFVMRGD